jgi:GntR family transcriptional regulator of arabinose operon
MANVKEGKLYKTLVDYMQGQIERGVYQPEDKLPTEQVLADMFHVSRITSTRALNELQAMGLIVRKQGSGSFVTTKKPNNGMPLTENFVAMIMPYGALQGRLHEILLGVSSELEKSNYHLTIYNSDSDAATERALLERARNNGMRGIIIYPKIDNTNVDMVYDMWIHHYPLVTVDKKYADIPISNVCVDNYQGAYEITRHLLEFGHRNIGFITNRRMEEVYSIRERYFGYCNAMKDFGIAINYDYIVRGYTGALDTDEVRKQTADTVERLLKNEITALVAASDVVAFDILKGCETKKIIVPDDLSLVGFDNLTQSAFTSPPLTTCNQDFCKVGELATELLMRQIEKDDFSFVEKRVPTIMHYRESVREIPADYQDKQ